MIFYRPTDGDPQTTSIIYRPRTCFLLTQLREPLPNIITRIREELSAILHSNNIDIIDANTVVTGRDFLLKIWNLILSVPLGIAVVHEEMSERTLANIFYELGMMHAYGKETLVVKTSGFEIPSDLIRNEYVKFSDKFQSNIERYLDTFFKQSEYYKLVSSQLENNPLLAIDYLKRAYLISGDDSLREEAISIFNDAALENRARNSVEMLLIDF